MPATVYTRLEFIAALYRFLIPVNMTPLTKKKKKMILAHSSDIITNDKKNLLI